MRGILAVCAALLFLTAACQPRAAEVAPFQLMEATIADVHEAYKSRQLTARQLTQMYLDRIDAYDRRGPALSAVITINPMALEEAAKLDAAFEASGFAGPLHGIPVLFKDQIDVAGLPTTRGQKVLKDYVPTRDAFVVAKLRSAGAVVLTKDARPEASGGDTYGSLFGATRNPYDILRTAGGTSGGTSVGVAANFGTIGVGQEGVASIRRPAAWNSVVGMRPTAGLVSRSGVWGGWPGQTGSLGPIARTVTDLAKLLDAMVGYDPEDPLTALGVSHIQKAIRIF
jgi:Asp-tRNA(Asn)/Glu-tRNA(Gln) amidotransferase A subunit family amidase